MEEEKNEGTKQSSRRSHWSSGSDSAADPGTDMDMGLQRRDRSGSWNNAVCHSGERSVLC